MSERNSLIGTGRSEEVATSGGVGVFTPEMRAAASAFLADHDRMEALEAAHPAVAAAADALRMAQCVALWKVPAARAALDAAVAVASA